MSFLQIITVCLSNEDDAEISTRIELTPDVKIRKVLIKSGDPTG